MNIGEAAKKARQNAGLTRNQLASKAGYSYANLRNIEDNIANPRVDMVIDIADTLGISVDEYIGHTTKGGDNNG